jgi:hypothetical protein
MKTNVIIPVKNHNDFLGTQTMQDVNDVKYIFIIDLSSNEETINRSKILNDIYKNKNIEIHYVNFQNINKSFNFGLTKLDEDCIFVGIMEDDFHYPHKLRFQIKFLEERKDFGIVGSNHYAVQLNDGMRHEQHTYKENHNEIISRYFFDIAMCGPMFLIRREVFKLTDFGDEDMWCFHLVNSSKQKFKLYNIQDNLSCYYRYKTSNSVFCHTKFDDYIINNTKKNLEILGIQDVSARDLFYGIRLVSPSIETIKILKMIEEKNISSKVMPIEEFSAEINHKIQYIKNHIGL